jgi:hypothetical protein
MPSDPEADTPPAALGLVEIEVTERWQLGPISHAVSLTTRKLRLIQPGNP